MKWYEWYIHLKIIRVYKHVNLFYLHTSILNQHTGEFGEVKGELSQIRVVLKQHEVDLMKIANLLEARVVHWGDRINIEGKPHVSGVVSKAA